MVEINNGLDFNVIIKQTFLRPIQLLQTLKPTFNDFSLIITNLITMNFLLNTEHLEKTPNGVKLNHFTRLPSFLLKLFG